MRLLIFVLKHVSESYFGCCVKGRRDSSKALRRGGFIAEPGFAIDATLAFQRGEAANLDSNMRRGLAEL